MKYAELKITKDTLEYEDAGTTKILKNNLTVESFRKQVKAMEYEKYYQSLGGKKARNDDLENFFIPAIVHMYYYLLVTTGKIPTIEELCNAYIDKYTEKVFKDYQIKKEYRNGTKNVYFQLNDLKGRICRAYNSFHREVDLLLQLFEFCGEEFDFYYSFKEDYSNGVDLVAYAKDGQRYDIATYFSSARSLSYKKIKNENRHEYKNISIDLLAYFDGPDRNVERVGDAKLYNNKAVKYIYKKLKER